MSEPMSGNKQDIKKFIELVKEINRLWDAFCGGDLTVPSRFFASFEYLPDKEILDEAEKCRDSVTKFKTILKDNKIEEFFHYLSGEKLCKHHEYGCCNSFTEHSNYRGYGDEYKNFELSRPMYKRLYNFVNALCYSNDRVLLGYASHYKQILNSFDLVRHEDCLEIFYPCMKVDLSLFFYLKHMR